MRRITFLEFPLSVKWYITQRCNLRCSHCYLTDYTKLPSLDQMLGIVDFLAFKKVAGIVLIGGEPLVRRDLVTIVDRINSYGIKMKIATNATLVNAGMAKALVTAGVRNFQVSLEGAKEQTNDLIRGSGTFGLATKGIQLLRKEGADVSIAFTVTSENYEEIPEMFDLASRLSVGTLKLNAFIPIGSGRALGHRYSLSPKICRQVADIIERQDSLYPDVKADAGAFVKLVKFHKKTTASKSTFGCGAGTTSLIINSDLTLSACDMLVEEDRTSKRIQQPQNIDELWKGDPIFRRWRGGQSDYRTATIKSFDGVHQNGCHVAFNVYGSNIFRGE